MKNLSLVLNIVLLLAVGTLFYLYFKGDKPKGAIASQHHCSNDAKCTNAKIAYFDLDSLENNYEYAKEVQRYLTARDQEMQKALLQLRNEYIRHMKEYQQNGPNMSQQQQSEYQQQLVRLQNEYQQKEQDFSQEMQSETMRRMLLVKNRIQDILRGYSKENGYSFILATSQGDYMYFKDTAFNITPEVIRVLNEEYKKSKKQ